MGTRRARHSSACGLASARAVALARGLTLALALASAGVPAARADAPSSATPPAAAAAKSAPAGKPGHAPLHASLDGYPQSDLDIRSGAKTHRFRVWIADTFERREQGLMWIRKLPPSRGMLFVFEQPQLASFWMKNTYVPLDLLFVAPDGRVIRIAENAEPHSLANIDSMGYVTGVLELAGGTTKKLGVKTGDYVVHPVFARR